MLLKLHLYRQTSVATGKSLKPSPKFYGPFKVINKVGKVAYKLDLPLEAKIHNVFHVSQLMKAFGYSSQFIPLLDNVVQDVEFELIAILDRKKVKRGNRAGVQLLIHWKHLSPTEATWEFIYEIRMRFLDFSLEDKGL